MQNNISIELNAALAKAETDFGLREVLQKYGLSDNELVTVEFKFGDETLFVIQRDVNTSSNQRPGELADRQDRESQVRQQTSEEIGREVAEVFSRADVLSTFRNLLQERNVTISTENPVMVEIISAGGFRLTSLKCPCSDRPCCQV